MVPSIHSLTKEARQRLQAVEEFSDLGSGFNLSMRDLDIRGAGNMLGAEQSGFIEDVGFETYHKILDEAVQELRHDEFAEVFADQDTAPPPPEPTVDVEDDVFIPSGYVSNPVERLNLYRRLTDLDSVEEIDAFRAELIDRFGPAPQEIDTLLRLASMRPLAMRLRLPRVVWMKQRLFLSIPEPGDDPYFHTRIFHLLLDALNTSGKRYVMKENKAGKLRAILQDVPSLETSQALLGSIADTVEAAMADAVETPAEPTAA